jgi:hypothetical protein
MHPIFHAQLGVRIIVGQTGQFRSNIVMFETFEMQEFDDVTLLKFPGSGTFQCFMIIAVVWQALSSLRNPKFSGNPLMSRSY